MPRGWGHCTWHYAWHWWFDSKALVVLPLYLRSLHLPDRSQFSFFARVLAGTNVDMGSTPTLLLLFLFWGCKPSVLAFSSCLAFCFLF